MKVAIVKKVRHFDRVGAWVSIFINSILDAGKASYDTPAGFLTKAGHGINPMLGLFSRGN
jgi:hypothetical protein